MSEAYHRPRYLGNPKFRFRQRQNHGSERSVSIIWWIACAAITALVVFHFAVSVNELIGVHRRNLQHTLSPPDEETPFVDPPQAAHVITESSSTNHDASSSISASSVQQLHTFIHQTDPVRPSARGAEVPAKLMANRTCDFRIDQYKAQGLPQSRIESQKKIIEGRLREKETWFEKSCSRWGLSGDWKDRGRKIYYSLMVAAELQLLLVLLEEIYPVVDVLIFQEAKHTWRMGYMEEKEMFFAKYNFSYFQKYAPKIRYFEYDFDWVEECMPKNGVPEYPTPRCKWMQQWHARNQLARGATDIEDHDIFVVADLDEMISREFLLATKHCIVHEEMEQPGGKCTKVTVRTFGHKYNFECTALNPAGHFHPDLTTGRCMRDLGPEEVRMYYGSEWNNQNKEDYTNIFRPVNPPVQCTPRDAQNLRTCSRPGTLPIKTLGPAGWHMHSFLSNYFLLFKQFSRSGPTGFNRKWRTKEFEDIKQMKRDCTEFQNIFKYDAWGCMPLPHAIRENPLVWRHFVEYVDDEYTPDPFGVEAWAQALLNPKHADDKLCNGHSLQCL